MRSLPRPAACVPGGPRRRVWIRLGLLAMILGLALAAALPSGALAALSSSGSIYYSQTGHTLNNGFLSYWLWHGQADRWGYPITEELQEGGLTVQYLERGRIEYNPAAPAESRITASATGSLLTADRAFPAVPAIRPSGTATYFAQTGHTLRGGFYNYWRGHGAEDSFGLPISEEFVEGGHTVQYFQRARFELTADGGIWLGHIGRELLARRNLAVPAAPRPEFEMTFTGGATHFPGNWSRIISLNQSWGNLPSGYHGYGLYAAMPADLNLYGRWGRVTRNGKTIWVQFIDVINYPDIPGVRADGKVIDLGTESFAQFAPLSDGVIRVTVDVAWPGFQPEFTR